MGGGVSVTGDEFPGGGPLRGLDVAARQPPRLGLLDGVVVLAGTFGEVAGRAEFAIDTGDVVDGFAMFADAGFLSRVSSHDGILPRVGWEFEWGWVSAGS